mgnify:CR=1 FL=1
MESVKVKQDSWDSPLRVKDDSGRSLIITMCILIMTVTMCSIDYHASVANEQREQQIELARRQYALDSLRFEHIKQHRR